MIQSAKKKPSTSMYIVQVRPGRTNSCFFLSLSLLLLLLLCPAICFSLYRSDSPSGYGFSV